MIQLVLAILAAECCDSPGHFGIISRSDDQRDTLKTITLVILVVLNAIAIIPIFFYVSSSCTIGAIRFYTAKTVMSRR